MSSEVIIAVIGAVTTAIGSFWAWKSGFKTSNANTKTIELNNVDEAIKIWRTIAQELSAEVKNYSVKVKEYEEQQQAMLLEYNTLNAQNVLLIKKIDKLQKVIEELKASRNEK
jgi:hypothetical protein